MIAIVPTFRPDLDREIDLVEEVARRIGFDHIGRTLPDTHGQVGALTVRQRERRLVADALVGVGLSEAITLSLVAPERPRARRRAARSRRARHQPVAGGGVGAAHRGPPRPAPRRRRQPRARA